MIFESFQYSNPFIETTHKYGYKYKISFQKSNGRKVDYLFQEQVISEDTLLKFKRVMEHPNFNSSLNTKTFRNIVLFFVGQMSNDDGFDDDKAKQLVQKINETTATVLASFFATLDD